VASENVPVGIKLILEEMRDTRVDMRGMREDMRGMREDMRGMREDMLGMREEMREMRREADRDRARSDARFEKYVADTAKREADLSRALVIIGQTGRRILKTLDEHTVLLRQISRKLDVRGNGRKNGH